MINKYNILLTILILIGLSFISKGAYNIGYLDGKFKGERIIRDELAQCVQEMKDDSGLPKLIIPVQVELCVLWKDIDRLSLEIKHK